MVCDLSWRTYKVESILHTKLIFDGSKTKTKNKKQKNQVVILHDLCVHMARPLRSLA